MISVTYAGAGGGKTTGMVERVANSMKDLNPNRFLCVVTYTNEAARDIQQKLNLQCIIPPNVFIGTIHSFLIRFVIRPHFENGGELGIVSQLRDKDDLLPWLDNWSKKKSDNQQEQKRAKDNYWRKKKEEIYAKLLSSNLITYDQVVKYAKDIVSKASARHAIARKIQFLFVDEYQDTYKWQHEVFIAIHKCKKTAFHVIGDPHQSIYSFTYGKSENEARRPKSYDDFPICQLRKKCKVNQYHEIKENHRSSWEIVKFVNQYNQEFQQNSVKESFSPVIAIESNDPELIFKAFHSQRNLLGLSGNSFYLSKHTKTLHEFQNKITVSCLKVKCIRSIEASILQFTGLNMTDFCEQNGITRFQLRTLAVLCEVHDKITLEAIKMEFKEKFCRPLTFREQDVEMPVIMTLSSNVNERALTIHKSKGLESESVLVVFKTNNELEKVLTKISLMKSPSDDDLRLAYVAFSRAQKLLFLCCLERLTDKNKQLLLKKNVAFV